jgi:gluconolactonase
MQIDVFQSGLGFIEGPAWTADGRLSLVSISHGCIYTLDGSGAVRDRIPTGGGPNGLASRGGELFVAQNGGIFGASGVTKGGVQRIADGRGELLFAEAFTAPNDICFGPDGRLYVTDPLTDKALTEPVEGRLLACDLATGEAEVLVDKRLFPNGLAFDASGEVLYLAQTYPRVIERFTFRNGRLSSDGILCTLAKGRPDGMAIDQEGKLWICTPGTGGVEVFTREGKPLQRIEFGEGTMTTNCCFGGPKMTDLFVTAAGRGSVLRVDAGVPGLPLYPR